MLRSVPSNCNDNRLFGRADQVVRMSLLIFSLYQDVCISIINGFKCLGSWMDRNMRERARYM
jgi:hypothetical protein